LDSRKYPYNWFMFVAIFYVFPTAINVVVFVRTVHILITRKKRAFPAIFRNRRNLTTSSALHFSGRERNHHLNDLGDTVCDTSRAKATRQVNSKVMPSLEEDSIQKQSSVIVDMNHKNCGYEFSQTFSGRKRSCHFKELGDTVCDTSRTKTTREVNSKVMPSSEEISIQRQSTVTVDINNENCGSKLDSHNLHFQSCQALFQSSLRTTNAAQDLVHLQSIGETMKIGEVSTSPQDSRRSVCSPENVGSACSISTNRTNRWSTNSKRSHRNPKDYKEHHAQGAEECSF